MEEWYKMVQQIGFPIVIALLLWQEISKRFTKQDKTEDRLIKIVTDNITTGIDKLNTTLQEIKFIAYKTTLSKHEVMQVVSDKFCIHIRKKQNVLNDVLEKNNLKTRRCQIEQRITTEFKEITRQECSELNIFNTRIGAVGNLIMEMIDWDKFLQSVFEIVFSEDEKKIKLRDTENLMNGYVSDIKSQIEDQLTLREKQSESFQG